MNKPVVTQKALVYALVANAALLVAILVVLLARDGGGSMPQFLSAAYGQHQVPIAGGAGVFVMPAQLSPNNWGCYLLDVDAQTLAVYQYAGSGGSTQLKFVAARSFRWDRRVENYNTLPAPREIQDMVEKAQQAIRGEPNEAKRNEEPKP